MENAVGAAPHSEKTAEIAKGRGEENLSDLCGLGGFFLLVRDGDGEGRGAREVEDGESGLLNRLHAPLVTAAMMASATASRRANPRRARVDLHMPFHCRAATTQRRYPRGTYALKLFMNSS